MPTLRCGHDTDDFETCPKCELAALRSQLEAAQAGRARLAQALQDLRSEMDTHKSDYNRRSQFCESGAREYWHGRRDEAGYFRDKIDAALSADDRAAAELLRAHEREHDNAKQIRSAVYLYDDDMNEWAKFHDAVEAAKEKMK